MLRKNHFYLLIILILCLFSRLITSIYYIEDIDSLRFAFSILEYDLTKFQPHFPGYPVFCFLAKNIYFITKNMGVTFSIIGGFSVFYIIYYLLKITHNEINSLAGIFLSFVIFFNPLFWLMSTRYMPDILGLAIVIVIFYELILRKNDTSRLYIGFFLTGILAGIRLSYLPVLIIPFITQIVNSKNKIKLIVVFFCGISIWLFPLIWVTGFESLLSTAFIHTHGHFMDFGGSIITEKHLISRFAHLVESIWADGMGGYWLNRSWVTAIFSLFLATLLILGLKMLLTNWKNEKVLKIIFSSIMVYLLWIFFFQNIIFKSRHVLPILIFLFIMLNLGFKYILTKKPAFINITVIPFVLLLIGITTKLVFDHKNPTAIAQLKNDLLEQNNNPTIISTPLINYYLKSNQVKTNFINFDDNTSFKKYINQNGAGKILMIGNFKSLFIDDFFIKPNKTYYHNPYINRMWTQIDTYHLIRKQTE